MNILKPVSTIMTSQLITVGPNDPLTTVKKVFENHNIHHIPVVDYRNIIGLVSKSDYDQFLHRSGRSDKGDNLIEKTRLETWKVKDVMTDRLAKIDSQEPIRTALELFKLNKFHALPVVDNDDLVGMVTTFDIIDAIAREPIQLDDYRTVNS